MSIYDGLRDLLLFVRELGLRDFELSFAQIERFGFLLPDGLPPTAQRPQWWANQSAPGRPQREAWRLAGYDAFLIRGSNRVKFRKVA
jgi:hypothetical protein